MNRAAYKKKITSTVQSMGTYREEFDIIIDQLALIYEMRDRNLKQWKGTDKDNPYPQVLEYTNKAGATNLAKHPCFLNNLQYGEQILKYLKALGLTPTDAKKMNVELEKEEDTLAQFQS